MTDEEIENQAKRDPEFQPGWAQERQTMELEDLLKQTGKTLEEAVALGWVESTGSGDHVSAKGKLFLHDLAVYGEKPTYEDIDEAFDSIAALVTELGPLPMTRGLNSWQANKSILACLQELKNRYAKDRIHSIWGAKTEHGMYLDIKDYDDTAEGLIAADKQLEFIKTIPENQGCGTPLVIRGTLLRG